MTKHLPNVLAFVGLAGTGKSTLVQKIADKTNWPTVYFGGVVLAETRARGLAINPENEAQVRESLRADLGPACMAVKALENVDIDALETPLLIDGLYSDAELKHLQALLGERLIVAAVHSSFAVRTMRLGQRPVRPLTAEQIRERDRAEIENLGKALPIALADHHFVNDGAQEALSGYGDMLIEIAQGQGN